MFADGNGRCEIWAPVGGEGRNVHRFTAPGGVPPYTDNGDLDLDAIGFGSAGLRTNATVRPDGRLALDEDA
ncbi:MAG TPA: hypothetical protein VHF89_03200 [Solirubrobacteraceae bacterium]|nr:hypothetical protein [Solirubrobacteraceae bacterium]